MKHILFIDPISKLNIKKDSSLMIGLHLMDKTSEVYLLFEEDFYVSTEKSLSLTVYKFSGSFKKDGFYLESFNLEESMQVHVDSNTTIHMRIDPPYDIRYQRYLWMLDYLQTEFKACVVNDPIGIMKFNEKLSAFKQDKVIPSFVGSSKSQFLTFCEKQRSSGVESLILKPLDLYSGIGVEKVSLSKDDFEQKFLAKVKEYQGAIIAQPYMREVESGEYRSIYLNGAEVGTIMKTPPQGEFLANIAQGATFKPSSLPKDLKAQCDIVAKKMLAEGLPFLAFDLLAGTITEINVTCPGLLVEVSFATGKDISKMYVDMF